MGRHSELAEALSGAAKPDTNWVAHPETLLTSAADQERRRKVARAKMAGSSVTGSGGGVGGPVSERAEGLREQILEAMNISGRL